MKNKKLHGVGYVGIGKYKSRVGKKFSRQYNIWQHMIRRGYSEKYHEKYPTYKDVTVCDEWLNFQNFAKWYDENYYEIGEERVELDKDILFKGNKIYSPNTCVFVPRAINSLFTKTNKLRGEYPLGVTSRKSSFFATSMNQILKKKIHIGTYSTPELAFQAYKEYKESHIKEVADLYKDKIPKKLYDALYVYEVEITD